MVLFKAIILVVTPTVAAINTSVAVTSSTASTSRHFLEPSTYLDYLLGGIIGALVGLILGYIISPWLEPKVNRILSKINPFVYRKKKKIGGTWTHNWHVQSSRFPLENITTGMRLSQVNNSVSAKYIVKDNDGKEYTYAMEGKIDSNNYIGGEWYDMYEGNTYHGTFLLYIDVNMDTMEGTWIGKSQDNKVKTGKWEWKRES